jgi:sugar/nucleoside kinase (ribokinase family)
MPDATDCLMWSLMVQEMMKVAPISKKVAQTPLKTGLYKTGNHYTPFTDVLSDPKYDEGNGERIFINNIGAAWDMNPSDLKDSFFRSDLIVFGGTALVPNIHNALDHLLERAKVYHAITIVNTVFDFLSEKHDPVNPWKLGSSEKTYRSIDLLITDREESLRLSGTSTVEAAMKFFKKAGVGSLIITHGSNDIHFFADNALFGLIPKSKLPVSAKVRSQLKEIHEPAGDTTGCGDNFAGGVIASIAVQLLKKQGPHIDFKRAISLGVASGGYTCFYNGGTYFEDHPGSKAQLIEPYYQEYLKQINLLT